MTDLPFTDSLQTNRYINKIIDINIRLIKLAIYEPIKQITYTKQPFIRRLPKLDRFSSYPMYPDLPYYPISTNLTNVENLYKKHKYLCFYIQDMKKRKEPSENTYRIIQLVETMKKQIKEVIIKGQQRKTINIRKQKQEKYHQLKDRIGSIVH